MKPTILLVDDEMAICSTLYRTFRQHNFQVYQAINGEQALDILEKNKIDVVLSDQKMPGMKGTELLTMVRDRYPDTRRMILSGHSDTEDMEAAINDAAVSCFLHKPWDTEKLLQAVNDQISSRQKDEDNSGIDIEQAIMNDELVLQEEQYLSRHQNGALHYLNAQWPEFEHLQHNGIVNIARQSGCLHNLFTWYLLKSMHYVELHQYSQKQMVIDMFCDNVLLDHSLKILLGNILHHKINPLVKISIDNLYFHEGVENFLNVAYLANSEVILRLDNRIVDLNKIGYTPVRYIELDGNAQSINNSYLTEQRVMMMNDAKNLGINTILSKDHNQTPYDYVRDMEFDFF